MGHALDTKHQAFGIILTLADDGWGINISYELLAIIVALIVALVGMSALGHKQTCAVQKAMSALPPRATEKAESLHNPNPSRIIGFLNLGSGRLYHGRLIPRWRHRHLKWPTKRLLQIGSLLK
jgi:hypothetical protein